MAPYQFIERPIAVQHQRAARPCRSLRSRRRISRRGDDRSDRARLGAQGRLQGRIRRGAVDPVRRRPSRRRALRPRQPIRRKRRSSTGKLARALPAGKWHIETAPLTANRLALGYGLGSYRFDRYKSAKSEAADADDPAPMPMPTDIKRQLAGVFLARDLINTPTNDMGPERARRRPSAALAEHYKAEVSVITGDDLLKQNFPLVHTVGRASAEAPRLLELRWGKKGHRKVTLVGKGVCFDTGGLDIKPAASMLLMKKDMGGAANVMGLALMIMDAKLKVDLRVIVPVVENSISANAFRPGDIYRSRKGLTVQIDNTDAEGRLILADALAYADEEKTDLLIDMATLTGAARVALGPDLPPFFTDDDDLAHDLTEASLDGRRSALAHAAL